MSIRTGAASIALAAMTIAASQTGYCQTANASRYDLPSQALETSLRAVARMSGRDIIISTGAVEGKVAPELHGSFTPDEAVRRLVSGSGVAVRLTADAVLIGSNLLKDRNDRVAQDGPGDIVVTGSRIRKAPTPSHVVVQTQEQMRDAGQNTLMEVIRTIPQNFNGGQNPGIGQQVPVQSGGSNIGAASSINLRGLGSDATLTLVNGHRLPYSSSRSSIDVSSIPFLAIDRIEIVADGASALYGSDAVGGVANILLKRDYDGVLTSARFGAATDGGYEQQQYGVLAGRHWSTGGIVAAYEFERDTEIVARQRSYAAEVSPGLTLFPSIKRHNVMIGAHQEISPEVNVAVDGLYNKRWSTTRYQTFPQTKWFVNGNEQNSTTESFVVAPSVTFSPSTSWEVTAAGVYGEERARFDYRPYRNGVLSRSAGCYCNTAKSVEVNADGELLALPAGALKVAFGTGYRENRLFVESTIGSTQPLDGRQKVYYAFGEVSVPLIAPSLASPLGDALTLSAAARYENYRGIDKVISPKLGAIYSPTGDVDLKLSWGKSFKAPTLYQQFTQSRVDLDSPAYFGGSAYPTGSTILFMWGGNPNLEPERATTWSTTLSLHPRSLSRLRLDVSYFQVKYRDRVVIPLTYTQQALSNPIYADLVERNPSAARVTEVVEAANRFDNYTAGLLDPSSVVAIINSAYLNATQQDVRGVDATLSYDVRLGGNAGELKLSGNAGYIDSHQRLSDLQPETNLAGTLYNPPHFRARAGGVWKSGDTVASAFVNYTGGVSDVRSSTPVQVSSMTTVDLSVHYKIGRIFQVGVAAQNVLNQAPGVIATNPVYAYEAPYDSTNYSPFGRVVSFSLTANW